MEKRAGPNDIHYPLMPNPESRGTSVATFSIYEEATAQDKEGATVHLLPPSPSPSFNPSHPSTSKRKWLILSDTFLLLSILLMVVWPWSLFGAIRGHGGIQMSPGLTDFALNHPQLTTVVVTLIGTLNRIAATFLFGCTIVRYGQERVAKEGRPLTVFGVSALLAFRHMSLMWGIGEWWALFKQGRRLAVIALLFLSLAALALIPSGTAGLLAPVRFNKTSALTGSEVDFTSIDPDCVQWMEQTLSNYDYDCSWEQSWEAGYLYPSCSLTPPLNDVLSAGQRNMLIGIGGSVPQQPMSDEPARFLGPLRGILPLGPDGFRGFNMLANWSSPYSSSPSKLDYSYTVLQQGLESVVTCSYETDSPILFSPLEGLNSTIVISASGNCDPFQGVRQPLENIVQYVTLNANSTLTFWACATNQSSPAEESDSTAYFLYLRGRVNYRTSVGNMTCFIPTLRSRDYAVTYTSSRGYFTAERADTFPEPGRNTVESFRGRLIQAFGNAIWEAQTWSKNSIAESVFRPGARFLGLSTTVQNERYLGLYEAMIQGVLEYFAMNARLVLSLKPIMATAPASCIRPVHGNLTYEVLGWYPAAGNGQVWLLIPMTLTNLASLAIWIAAMRMGRFQYRCNFEPMDTRAMLTARVIDEKVDSDEENDGRDKKVDWEDGVKFREAF